MLNEASNTDLRKVEKQDRTSEDFKVREGQEDNAVSEQEQREDSDAYPLHPKEDEATNNQTEFLQRDNNESKSK